MSLKKQKTTHPHSKGLPAVSIRAISVLLIVGAISTIGVHELLPSHAATATLPFQEGTYISQYNGGPMDPTKYPGYDSWLGHTIPLAEGFGNLQSYPASPTGDEQAIDCPWFLDNVTALGKTVITSFDFMTSINGGKSDGETWATMAVGSNKLPSGFTVDQRYKAFAQCLVDHHQQNAIIRMATEFNLGGTFPWGINIYDTTQVANFVSAERTFVTDARSVAGQNFKFDWNIALDAGNPGQNIVTNAYPGDAYVDYIGIDTYDQVVPYGSTWTNPQDQWNRRFNGYNGANGIKYYLDFAKSHGKKISFPEWGGGWYYGNNSVPTDDPYYINQMFAVMNDPANNVAYESYWEDGNGLYTHPSNQTNAVAAFKADFGAIPSGTGGTGTTTPPTTTPPTTTPPSTPTVTPVTVPFRMRAGGAAYSDPSGNAWVSDTAYTTDGSTDSQGAGKITGTTNTALYENERWSNPHIGYAIPIANGTYTLNLHFAEISPNVTAAGGRVFSGTAEGQTLFTNLDIYSEVGADKPDDKSYQVTVTNGELDISLDSSVNAAKLSGLEILPASTGTGSGTPTTLVGDVNGDGHVNTLDLSILLTHDGTNYAPADLNHDGTVGAADLAILLSHWKW